MNNLNFIAIDLETATSYRGSICEIGLAFVENGNVVNSKSWLVRPKNNQYDSFNISIHGITPKMTKNSPSFKEVWNEILPFIQNKVIVAHNTSFDMYAINDAIMDASLPLPEFEYYCSLRIARKAFPGLYSYSLPLICEATGIPFGSHHRAEGDAVGCANIFIKAIPALGIESIDVLPQRLNIRKGEFNGSTHIPQRQNEVFKNKESLLKSIIADASKFEEDNYFFGKSVCFTGSFSFGNRKNLLQAIANIGGIPMDSVTKATNVLIVGQQDYRKVGEQGMSGKQKKALSLIEKGQDLEIMSEAEFLTNFGGEIPTLTN